MTSSAPASSAPTSSALSSSTRPLLVGNCSGFYGDRASAALEMVEGGPLDVLTGDYLAELTMMILWKARERDGQTGYAKTFLAQMEETLGTCLDKGVKVVTNAGGLNPGGLAEALAGLADRLGLAAKVSWIGGDDVLDQLGHMQYGGARLEHLDTGIPLREAGIEPVTANAYLGGWGIAEALAGGADVVVCPRVSDASLVVGPAAWHHGWKRDHWDCLAGAVVAGHIIECGTQATGGNYAFFAEVLDRRPFGFPIAEVAHDGSCVITKHPDTGGLVSVGTVTSQVLYEIEGQRYINPDVVARFDTIELSQEGPNRVHVFGARGEPAPSSAKVCINYLGGFRNSMTFALTGLEIEEKATMVTESLFRDLGGRESFAESDVRMISTSAHDASSNEGATAHLQITVKDSDSSKVGRAFSNAVVAQLLASYPGCYLTTPPTSEASYGVYWPTLIPVEELSERVVHHDGREVAIVPSAASNGTSIGSIKEEIVSPVKDRAVWNHDGPFREVPLGTIIGARSGDKGGNANIGLWAQTQEGFDWLESFLSGETFKTLVPEAKDLEVRRFVFPLIWSLNFVVVGLLGEGVASSVRPDAQAKSLGEFIRSRMVNIPQAIFDSSAI